MNDKYSPSAQMPGWPERFENRSSDAGVDRQPSTQFRSTTPWIEYIETVQTVPLSVILGTAGMYSEFQNLRVIVLNDKQGKKNPARWGPGGIKDEPL